MHQSIVILFSTLLCSQVLWVNTLWNEVEPGILSDPWSGDSGRHSSFIIPYIPVVWTHLLAVEFSWNRDTPLINITLMFPWSEDPSCGLLVSVMTPSRHPDLCFAMNTSFTWLPSLAWSGWKWSQNLLVLQKHWVLMSVRVRVSIS